ncbi:MAG: NADH-quinone oxidoreductase subunit N [Candidatus Caenarcaniphilales bacterium]|nr:NADH-quinone oxidoreductase subunit N [Candidatus Caenarcaniphilales bacterium]
MVDLNSLKTLVDNNDLLAVFPEFCIIAAMFVSLGFSLAKTTSHRAAAFSTPFLALGLAFCILLFSKMTGSESIYSFKGTYLTDSFSLLLKGLLFLALLCLSFGSWFYLKSSELTSKGEYQFLLLGASLGASFLISANDLILLFVALETLSLSSIALVAYVKKDSLGGEAAIKYLLNGAIASACLLFSLSLYYGITFGSTSFSAFPNMLLGETATMFMRVFPYIIFSMAMFLTIAAISFKLSLAPFHMWAPDVYNGSNLPTAAFLATISKLAAFAIFCHMGWTIFSSSADTFRVWSTLFALLAILSMIVGNFVGARQVFRAEGGSLKRLFAYSSVAQIGYVMTSVVLGPDWSTSQGLFYLTMYVVVNLGAFLALIKVEEWYTRNNIESVHPDSIDALKGLYKIKPKLAVFLGVCVANLAAVFPAMLLAKIVLLDASLHAGISSLLPEKIAKTYGLTATNYMVAPIVSLVMAATILITSVVAIFYYTTLIKKMFVDEPLPEVQEKLNKTETTNPIGLSNFSINFACSILLFASVILSVFPEFWINKVTGPAAQALFVSSSSNLLTTLDETEKKAK